MIDDIENWRCFNIYGQTPEEMHLLGKKIFRRDSFLAR